MGRAFGTKRAATMGIENRRRTGRASAFVGGVATGALALAISLAAWTLTSPPGTVSDAANDLRAVARHLGPPPEPPILPPSVGLLSLNAQMPTMMSLFGLEVDDAFIALVRERHGRAYVDEATRRPAGIPVNDIESVNRNWETFTDQLDAAAERAGWVEDTVLRVDSIFHSTRGYVKDGHVFAVHVLTNDVTLRDDPRPARDDDIVIDRQRQDVGERDFTPITIVTSIPSDHFDPPWLGPNSWVMDEDWSFVTRAEFQAR